MMIIREKYLKQVLRFLLPRKKEQKRKKVKIKKKNKRKIRRHLGCNKNLLQRLFVFFLDTEQMFLELLEQKPRSRVRLPVWYTDTWRRTWPIEPLSISVTVRLTEKKISDLYFRQPLVDRRFFLHFIWSPKVIFNSMKGVFFRVVRSKANFRMTGSLKMVLSGSWIQTH